MSSSKSCGRTNLDHGLCMIELIVADLRAHYGQVGGGGVSRIVAASSTSYTVSLPQEGHVDLLTYEFEVASGTVTLTKRSESTENY